tara:strand:+ start:993 stop:1145 length:153 start_codon:yes stop_codon:yes gene_type:complete
LDILENQNKRCGDRKISNPKGYDKKVLDDFILKQAMVDYLYQEKYLNAHI